MEKEYLSVNEFAKAVGFTPQGIYKKLKDENSGLKKFTKKINGTTYIAAVASVALFNKDYKPQEQPKEENNISTDKIIDILKEQIEAQRKDIEEKNKLIDTLAAQLEREQTLLSQEQQLNLVNTKKIIELEAAAEEKEAAAKKSGIFGIFRKRKIEK